MARMKYYKLNRINKTNAVYRMVIGERSNGKTYAVLEQVLREYQKNRSQFVYIRRWQADVKRSKMLTLFNNHQANGLFKKIFKGEFDGVYFYSGTFYLCTYDENGKAIYNDSDVLGYAFALSENEHVKSSSYPKVDTIVFDEFLTRGMEIPDEFVSFMNIISTVVRKRTNVKIYMLANTVNRYSVYFKEMGLNKIRDMKQGDLDVYKYGNSNLTVAVEYTESNASNSPNNFYFAFDNPKLAMITGGAWELDMYPHAPIKFGNRDILFSYFIEWAGRVFQCDIVYKDKYYFTYIHNKTTPIKNPKKDLIYSLDNKPLPNYNESIFKPRTKMETKIADFYRQGRIYYQDNEVGDAVNNYIKRIGGNIG